MKIDKGYIAIANKQWCDVCLANKLDFVNIWTRRPSFKAVCVGSPIFFLEKGTRLLKGFGIFKEFEIDTVLDTWQYYTFANGANNYIEFLNILNLPDNSKVKTHKLGNILIENVVWSNTELPIDATTVSFHKAIVSGKTISKDEVFELIKSIKQ